MFNFEKEIVETIKGTQTSEYDALLPLFDEPGTTLRWDESEVKRTKASQISARLNLIGDGKVFHSGYDVLKKKVFVRLRTQEEIDKKAEKKLEANQSEVNQNNE